ncbi:hypothetical protein BH09BAC3_BH09BAC3_08930 [soil metagenome]
MQIVGCHPGTNHRSNTEDFDKSILGIWTDGSTENASFRIQKDSVFDVEHFTTTKYIQKEDSVLFYYQEGIYPTKVYKTHNDTLIYEVRGSKTKYWKFKN